MTLSNSEIPTHGRSPVDSIRKQKLKRKQIKTKFISSHITYSDVSIVNLNLLHLNVCDLQCCTLFICVLFTASSLPQCKVGDTTCLRMAMNTIIHTSSEGNI